MKFKDGEIKPDLSNLPEAAKRFFEMDGDELVAKYIDVDALQAAIKELDSGGDYTVYHFLELIDAMPVADVEPVRHGLIEQVRKYAADMEERYTEVCADFRERTGQDYVCGACKYGDCVYLGADGDYCGECPGFESDECFVLSDELKSKIWKIVDIVSGAKMDEGGTGE